MASWNIQEAQRKEEIRLLLAWSAALEDELITFEKFAASQEAVSSDK